MKQEISRRGFLGAFVGTLSALGVVRITAGEAAASGEKWVLVGKTGDFGVGEAKLIKDEKVYVIRNKNGLFAMSAACTHLGCAVDRLQDGTYLCPCHGSSYDAKGLVTHGPAKKSLVWYQTRESDGEVYVNFKGIVEPAS